MDPIYPFVSKHLTQQIDIVIPIDMVECFLNV